MSDDLEYFTEFLADPSVPDLNEFFRILRRWMVYITEHKDEFNYLLDDEWKEIRERLIGELEIRVDQKDELEYEWEDLIEEILDHDRVDYAEWIELLKRRLEFMKTYNYIFDIPEADIIKAEKEIKNMVMLREAAYRADQAYRFSKLSLDQAIADLDDKLTAYYQRTGKIPIYPVYKEKKVYKGN